MFALMNAWMCVASLLRIAASRTRPDCAADASGSRVVRSSVAVCVCVRDLVGAVARRVGHEVVLGPGPEPGHAPERQRERRLHDGDDEQRRRGSGRVSTLEPPFVGREDEQARPLMKAAAKELRALRPQRFGDIGPVGGQGGK